MNSVFSPVQQFLITWLLVLVTGWFTLGAIHYVAELISILVTAGLIAFLLNYAVARLQVFLPRGRGGSASLFCCWVGYGGDRFDDRTSCFKPSCTISGKIPRVTGVWATAISGVSDLECGA